MKPTAILQIRTNSSRLPGKMVRPFHDGKTIPDLIIHQLIALLGRDYIVVATTTSKDDEVVCEMADRHGVKCFRGSEADVLARFIGAIDAFGLTTVIRVCADNPFLRPEYIQVLIDAFDPEKCDYATFQFPDGTPIMQSHIGLFAEIMTASFLQRIDALTSDPFYHEHVTNYVYTHRDAFRTLFLPVPAPVDARRDIRLTIDTPADFEHLSGLYKKLTAEGPDFSVDELIGRVDASPGLLEAMQQEIVRNSK